MTVKIGVSVLSCELPSVFDFRRRAIAPLAHYVSI